MDRPNLRVQITKFLRDVYPNYIHNGRLQKMAEEFGYMGSTWDRLGRQLRKKGILESMKDEKGRVHYRWKRVNFVKPVDRHPWKGRKQVELV